MTQTSEPLCRGGRGGKNCTMYASQGEEGYILCMFEGSIKENKKIDGMRL